MSEEYLAASQAIFAMMAELRAQETQIEKITLTDKALEAEAKAGARRGLSSRVEALLAQHDSVIAGKFETDCLKAYLHSLNEIGSSYAKAGTANVAYPVLDTLVDDLNIPQLCKTALKKDGITYIGQLAQTSEDHLTTLKTEYGSLTVFGPRRLMQLKDELREKHNLQLGMSVDYKPPYGRDPEKYAKIFDKPVDDLGLSTRARLGLRNNILYVGQIVQADEAALHRTPNIGDVSIAEIKSVLRTLGPLTLNMANINYKAPGN